MMRVTAAIMLLIITGTWSWLSIQQGYLAEVGDKFLWACAILFTGNIGEVLAGKWKGK